jgi:hypothetical protein
MSSYFSAAKITALLLVIVHSRPVKNSAGVAIYFLANHFLAQGFMNAWHENGGHENEIGVRPLLVRVPPRPQSGSAGASVSRHRFSLLITGTFGNNPYLSDAKFDAPC